MVADSLKKTIFCQNVVKTSGVGAFLPLKKTTQCHFLVSSGDLGCDVKAWPQRWPPAQFSSTSACHRF